MKIIRILFAGAVFSSALIAQHGDPGAAERFRAKFGRSAITQVSSRKAAPTAHNFDSTCDCCHGQHAS